MSAAPVALDQAAPRRGPSIAEFLAVGGATFILLPAFWVVRRLLGLDAAELAVGFVFFHAAHLINDPHFAVTYLLFYRDLRARTLSPSVPLAQRARYVLAGIVVPAALLIWAAVALHYRSAELLGWMIQLMFLLVGWHYVKQGFGVLVVLGARRGVFFSTVERGVLLAHGYAGWAYAWASPADPGREVEEKGVVYRTLAHGPTLERVTGVVFALSTVALIGSLAHAWRGGRRVPAAPLVGYLCSIWVWSVYSAADPLLAYAIPALHSAQYLYMVGLLKRNEARARELEESTAFGASVRVRLAWLALSAVGLGILLFHAGPSLLDAALVPRRERTFTIGPTPWFAALFTVVNLHHYFMDFAIWRRDNPDTRYLRSP